MSRELMDIFHSFTESDDRGMRSVRKQNPSPAYLARLNEAAQLVRGVFEGRLRPHYLQEAMTTSDFSNLFGDIIDRQMLQNYAEFPGSWPMYVKRGTVSDFRTVKRFVVNGAESVLAPVGQQSEYPESSVTDGVYSYAVKKYGRRLPFSWETMIDDDLDALKDMPARLAKAARRSEEKFVTSLFAANATYFASGNKNQVIVANGASSANPVLSASGVQDALIVLFKQLDNDGEPILIDGATLTVPPALKIVGQSILQAVQIWLNDRGGTTNERLITNNWMSGMLKLAVNPYLPIVDVTNGNTGWYIFADPNQGRPAMEMGFLRGHETPELFMKAPNSVSIGGGAANPMDGDFDTDSIQYKIRHVFGGTMMDPKMAVFSNGTGV